MLQGEQVLNKFIQEGIVYTCMQCRWKSRANFAEQLIDLMINEDKREDFLKPFWHSMPNYLSIVKNPICFSMIKNELIEY